MGRDDPARPLAPSPRELSPKVTEGVSQGVETRETLSKSISFSLLEKETVFGSQRKRGFLELGRCGVWGGGLRLYAPIGDQPRPLRPMWAEQGKVGALSLRRLGGGCRGVDWQAATGPLLSWGATTSARHHSSPWTRELSGAAGRRG